MKLNYIQGLNLHCCLDVSDFFVCLFPLNSRCHSFSCVHANCITIYTGESCLQTSSMTHFSVSETQVSCVSPPTPQTDCYADDLKDLCRNHPYIGLFFFFPLKTSKGIQSREVDYKLQKKRLTAKAEPVTQEERKVYLISCSS